MMNPFKEKHLSKLTWQNTQIKGVREANNGRAQPPHPIRDIEQRSMLRALDTSATISLF
jgi:hypothetical protein